MPRPAREIGAIRAHPRQRAIRNAVAVRIEIPEERRDVLQLRGRQHLAAIGTIGIVPGQRRHHPVVHAYVEIAQYEHRRLVPLGEIERRYREFERLARIGRIEADVSRVAVRRVGAHHQISLLRPRRHAGGRPGPLHVEDDGGYFRVIRQADELAHQRDSRTRRRRKGTRTGPRRADHHANRGQFVLCLKDRKPVATRLGLPAVLLAEPLEGFHQRRRRRDRIPGAHRCTGIDTTERSGRVAIDQNRVRRLVHRLEADWQRALEVRLRVVVAEAHGLAVRFHQRRFPAELLVEEGADDVGVHIEQRRQCPGVRDVLHQDPFAHLAELRVAHLGERDAEICDVGPRKTRIKRPRRVVDEPSAGSDFRDVLVVGSRVHRDEQIEVWRARGIAVPVDPNLVPGRQPLNVRREDIFPGDGHAHAEDRLHDEAVGRRRPGAICRRDLERELVYSIHGYLNVNWGYDLRLIAHRGSWAHAGSWLRWLVAHAPMTLSPPEP